MTKNPIDPHRHGARRPAGPPVALFWDQSLVWGLICVETLRRLGVPFDLLGAFDVSSGLLAHHGLLLVPGGWASHKLRALGEAGLKEIRHFIENGGNYLGFCGGAGMALSSPGSPGLVPLKRMPISRRLPSASGEVWIRSESGHPAWKDLPGTIPVSVWWPSQFESPLPEGSVCLASYQTAGKDFCVADLPIRDMERKDVRWGDWEKIYGINLDPKRLMGHPAIVEVPSGGGRIILSYPHLETPGNYWGNRLFLNLMNRLGREGPDSAPVDRTAGLPPRTSPIPPGRNTMKLLRQAADAAESLIGFGERHLLWKWRNPWLLQWRRGIRGLEYGTLAVSLRAMIDECAHLPVSRESSDPWEEPAGRLEADVRDFCSQARDLLLDEKLAIQNGNLRKLGKVNESVDARRSHLFGGSMNHGGRCQSLFDAIDGFLFRLIRMNPFTR